MKRDNKHPYTGIEISPMKCICCGSNVGILNPHTTKNADFNKPESQMWNDGVVDKFAAGYGSIFDGDIYYFALCDKCITEKKNNGDIVFHSNYMFAGMSDDMRNEYNTKLHRRIKLDRILNGCENCGGELEERDNCLICEDCGLSKPTFYEDSKDNK